MNEPLVESRDVHAYPDDLAAEVAAGWNAPEVLGGLTPRESASPPPGDVLRLLLSTCFQASLLREEGRPLQFRLLLHPPEGIDPSGGPPDSLHRLVFAGLRPFGPQELRRLAPATDFYRSLVGVGAYPEGLRVWGIAHSGERWLNAFFGGRKAEDPLPDALVVRVNGPGRLGVYRGSAHVATLSDGCLYSPVADAFGSSWMPGLFAKTRAEFLEQHAAARAQAGGRWAPLDRTFLRAPFRHIMRRIVGTVRDSGHGGTVVYVPEEFGRELLGPNRYLTLRYPFAEEEPRERMRTLLLRSMNTLAEVAYDPAQPDRAVGWEEYVVSNHLAVLRVEEAIFEVATLIAGLAAVDGAVILTSRHEILGFGAIIAGDVDKIDDVVQALDADGHRAVPLRGAGVGTRHRALYRLCRELRGAVGIVVSQDGHVQVVTWHNGAVTCWNQAASGLLAP
jgi:hypothetical protein